MLWSKGVEWLIEFKKQQKTTIHWLQETHFWEKDTHTLKVNGWKKIKFHANGKGMKSGLAILICDKTDFKTKYMIKDKGQNIIKEESIQEEAITLIKIYQ